MAGAKEVSVFLGGERINTPVHNMVLHEIQKYAKKYGAEITNAGLLVPKSNADRERSLNAAKSATGLVGFMTKKPGIDRGEMFVELTEVLHSNKAALIMHPEGEMPLLEALARRNPRLLTAELSGNPERAIDHNMSGLITRLKGKSAFEDKKIKVIENGSLIEVQGIVIDLVRHTYEFDDRAVPLTPTEVNLLLKLIRAKSTIVPTSQLLPSLRILKAGTESSMQDLISVIALLNGKIGDGRYEVEFRRGGYVLPVDRLPLPPVIRNGEYTLDLVKGTITQGENPAKKLGTMQFAVAVAFFQNRGIPFTNAEIAKKVWGEDEDVHYRNLRTVVYELRKKVQNPELIINERKQSWIMPNHERN